MLSFQHLFFSVLQVQPFFELLQLFQELPCTVLFLSLLLPLLLPQLVVPLQAFVVLLLSSGGALVPKKTLYNFGQNKYISFDVAH